MAYANDDQNLIEAQKQEMQELNPFWMKFLQPEKYYGGNQEIALLIEKVLKDDQVEETKNQPNLDRRAKEMTKIRNLEKQLADVNKKERQGKVQFVIAHEEEKFAEELQPKSA